MNTDLTSDNFIDETQEYELSLLLQVSAAATMTVSASSRADAIEKAREKLAAIATIPTGALMADGVHVLELYQDNDSARIVGLNGEETDVEVFAPPIRFRIATDHFNRSLLPDKAQGYPFTVTQSPDRVDIVIVDTGAGGKDWADTFSTILQAQKIPYEVWETGGHHRRVSYKDNGFIAYQRTWGDDAPPRPPGDFLQPPPWWRSAFVVVPENALPDLDLNPGEMDPWYTVGVRNGVGVIQFGVHEAADIESLQRELIRRSIPYTYGRGDYERPVGESLRFVRWDGAKLIHTDSPECGDCEEFSYSSDRPTCTEEDVNTLLANVCDGVTILHKQQSGLQALSEDDLLQGVARYQEVEKRNPPDSKECREASARLKPLFEEMARRQDAGELSNAVPPAPGM